MKEKPTPIVNLRPGQKVPNRRGANVLVAGIASNIKSGFSKEGKPTGSFLLDDGTGVVSVNFFGDDWLLYRNFVKSDELIFVKGNPREDKFSPTQIGIWGRKVEVPATIRAAKGVVVQIEITDPNFDMDVLKTVLQDHRPDVDDAGCRVAVKVTNGQEEALFTFSHEWDVYVNQQFLDDLEDVQGISYELMTRR